MCQSAYFIISAIAINMRKWKENNLQKPLTIIQTLDKIIKRQNMVRWRSGLTHMPFTHALTGSNPVRATISKSSRVGCFIYTL